MSTGPLDWEAALLLATRLRGNRTQADVEALVVALDHNEWWECFDVAAISEADIEAIVNYAIYDLLHLALRPIVFDEALIAELPRDSDALSVLSSLTGSRFAMQANAAVGRIITSMREHAKAPTSTHLDNE